MRGFFQIYLGQGVSWPETIRISDKFVFFAVNVEVLQYLIERRDVFSENKRGAPLG